MANITIKELIASDKVSEMVDKINFNFDQLLLNGGGPQGPDGVQGDLGPIGPRGTVWFSAVDIFTTSTSPSWSGTAERVNDPTVTGYPQYAGDPNRYLPIGQGSFPEDTFIIGDTTKQLREGDLYLQERDDNLNGNATFDGDVWIYDADTSEWTFTGVNIKGDTGATGATASSEWTREINPLDPFDDVLYPTQLSGQNVPRINVGSPTGSLFDEVNPLSASNFIGDGNPLISLMERSVHGAGNGADAATILVDTGGNLVIEGSSLGASRQIQMQASSANIFIDTGGGPSYTLDYTNSYHNFTAGPLRSTTPDLNALHRLENVSGQQIEIQLNTTIKNEINSNLDLVLQNTGGFNVGIGNFLFSPANKLTVAGNLSVGDLYKNISAPGNGAIIQGQTGIGTSVLPGDQLLQLGTGSNISLSLDLGIADGFGVRRQAMAFNTYLDGTTKKRTEAGAASYFQIQSSTGIVRPFTELVVDAYDLAGTALANEYRALQAFSGTGYLGLTGDGSLFSNTGAQEKLHIHDGSIRISESTQGISNGLNIEYNSFDAQIVNNTSGASDSKILITSNQTPSGETALTIFDDISKSETYVGIKSDSPKADLYVRGRDLDVDAISVGTLNDISITGLDRGTDTDRQGGAYVGFNTYFDSSTGQVTFETREGGGGSPSNTGAGFVIFMSRDGSMHIAMEYEFPPAAPMGPSPPLFP